MSGRVMDSLAIKPGKARTTYNQIIRLEAIDYLKP